MLVFVVLWTSQSQAQVSHRMPEGFVVCSSALLPNIKLDLRYHSAHNFVGDTINAYEDHVLIMTERTALALKSVCEELRYQGLGILVYDAYRPQIAVDHFVAWSKAPGDTITKNEFYPNLPKNVLFDQGYISSKSGHSRGSTVDLTVFDMKTGLPLDMGSPFDFFEAISWYKSSEISESQQKNRDLLHNIMVKHGFRGYDKEWWHFTLRNEPFPDTYFDFPIMKYE